MTTKIFISYRRQDSAATAGRLSDHIKKTFGRSSVFMDVSDMPLGKEFAKSLDLKLAQCDTFLAVIGTNWLNITGETGKRRIDEADDPVRTEIAMALSRKMLEPISKSFEEDDEASELHKAKEVLRMKLPADKDATLPLNPGEEPFDQPAPGISPKSASILRRALAAIGAVRRDHLDAVFA